MMTRHPSVARKRYAKQLIAMAMGNVTAIFLMPCLFGEPWSRVPTGLIAVGAVIGTYGFMHLGNLQTNIDDEQE